MSETLRDLGGKLFQLLVETVPDYAIFAMDTDGRIVHWNAGAARTTGYEEADVLGKRLNILFTPEQIADGTPERELRVAEETGRAEDERWHVRKDGTRFWAFGIVVPLRAADGSLLGFGKILRDRTDLKEMQENLRARADVLEEADKNKNRFLATLSHELRNPLAPLANSVEILRRYGRDEGKFLPIVDLMDRQLARLGRLVDDLLDVTRISQGKLTLRKERLNLSDLVDEAVQASKVLVDARGIDLRVATCTSPMSVDGDHHRLLQVFINLIENAAKFTPEGGNIFVVLDVEAPEAVVRIRDNGVGIGPEDAERIFDLFAQARPALDETRLGLGIGLAIVRDLVTLHGGTVQAQSAGQGKGSEFIVRLPLSESASR
ncbi:MAG TPA: PAS domain-containing sensor histidine kinase [Casimicrobiaceae bacterium]